MTRLYVMCIVALLAYGLTVGCWDGVHREARIEEHVKLSRGFDVVERVFHCKCGRRQPYTEVWR